jgi:hypothetical protein
MIMKKIIYTVILAAAVLTGCKEVTPELPTGLQLKVTTDDTFVDKIVKSSASVDINTFSVEIVKKDGKFSNTWLYGELPSLVELSVGEYTVTVNSPESVKVNWESPVYGGSMDFAILDGVVTPLDVVCTLQNMKNSVYCSENLIRSLSTFEVMVANADGFLVWSSDEVGVYSQSGDGTKTIIKEPAKQAYFSVNPLNINISGYRSLDGTSANLAYEIKKVEARDHHILYVDAYVTGQAQMTLSIDSSVNDIYTDVVMPGIDPDDTNIDDDIEVGWGEIEEEEQPGGGSLEAPYLEWPANPEYTKMDIVEGMNVELIVYAPAKIKEFIVRVSDNFLPAIQMLVPGVEYLDLINHEATKAELGTMLPVGDQLLGQTEVQFSLSTLVPLIAAVGEQGQDYVFTLEVTDEKDQKLVKDLVFYNPVTE